MPAQEVGEAYVAIRALAAGFTEEARSIVTSGMASAREQAGVNLRPTASGFQQEARAEVNRALAPIRESATIPIRTAGTAQAQAAFAPVGVAARGAASEVTAAHEQMATSSHHAYERVQLAHGGIRARFGETFKAASAMGGGIALAYTAYSQVKSALTATHDLAHATELLTTATGLNAKEASAWIAVAQSRGIASTSLQTSFNALSRVTSKASDDFAKSAAAHATALAKVGIEQQKVAGYTQAYDAAVQKYGVASSQATSASATLSAAQVTLQGYIAKTTASAGTNAAAFQALGITQQQLQQVQGNMPAELSLISDGFLKMGAGVDRSRAAQTLFGRSYTEILPLLSQGSAGLKDNLAQASAYGATLSGPTLDGMKKLRDEQAQLNLETLGLRVSIGQLLAPVLIRIGLDAVAVANQFRIILAGGIHFAKKELDSFLQTPYGQGLSTLLGDATRFAGQVRRVFVKDLSAPLSFGGLFSTFGTDLANKLPGMAKQFWDQLNKDLFAGGQVVRVPVTVHPHVQRGGGSTELAGAGIFPGSGFIEQGLKLGRALGNGILDALGKSFKSASSFGKMIGDFITTAVTWIVTGGGAARITSAGLQILNAFLNVFFDPSFWLQNWKVILNLAITLFPYDKFFVIPGRILEALGLSGVASRIIDRLFGPLIHYVKDLPTIIGSGILDFGKVVENAIVNSPGPLAGLRRLGGRLSDGFFHLLSTLVVDVIPRVIGAALTNLGDEINKGASTLLDKILGGFEGGFISRLFVMMAKFVTNATIIGIVTDLGLRIIHGLWDGIESGASWLESKVTGLFSDFIGWVEGILGISSPSRVAAQWGKNIVLGLVHGLTTLPIIGHLFSAEIAVVMALWRRFGGTLTAIVNAALALVRSEITLFGDLLHGRWSKIWGDLKNVASAALHLVVTIVRGLGGLMLAAAEYVGRKVWDGFKAELHALPGQVSGLVTKAVNAVSDLASWAYNEAWKLGGQLAGGVIDGVKSLPGKLGGAIKDEATSALKDVGGFFGIGSPSRVFRDKLGVPMGSGVVLGVQTGMSPLQSMMTRAIVGASNGALAAAKKALGIHSPSSVYADQIGRPLAEGIIHGMSGLEAGLAAKITSAARAATKAAGGFGGGVTPQGSAAQGANQVLGRQMMLAHGWGADQWGALQALWMRESGWNANAVNSSSGAAGIPQALGHGNVFALGDARAQIAWGLDYIAGRYGSPGAAWAHEQQVGWYGGGGRVPGAVGSPQAAVVHGGEVVFTPEQMSALSGRGVSIGQLIIHEPANGRDAADEFINEIAARVR